jgi:hypothetical protein
MIDPTVVSNWPIMSSRSTSVGSTSSDCLVGEKVVDSADGGPLHGTDGGLNRCNLRLRSG